MNETIGWISIGMFAAVSAIVLMGITLKLFMQSVDSRLETLSLKIDMNFDVVGTRIDGAQTLTEIRIEPVGHRIDYADRRLTALEKQIQMSKGHLCVGARSA